MAIVNADSTTIAMETETMKRTIQSTALALCLLSAASAQAELSALSDSELRSVEGQGYLITIGEVADVTVPTLAESDLVLGPIPASQWAAQVEQRHPRIGDARSLMVARLNSGALAALNATLSQDPVLRLFAPVSIELTANQ